MEVNFSIELSPKNTFQKSRQLWFSNKFWWPWITATEWTSYIAIWSLKTFCSWLMRMKRTSKLSTSVFQKCSAKENCNAWKLELELLTISHLKYLREITTNHAICGLLVAFYTFFFVDTHLFMETITTKFLRTYKKESSISTTKNGIRLAKKLKILSKNLLLHQKED